MTDEPTAYPSRRRAWITLALIMLAMVVSTLDRGIIPLLTAPIKASFTLSDTQFGALNGLAFGLFYVLMGYPLGMLADKISRTKVIAIGVGFFSLFSVASGFANTYVQLFLTRMGVGSGEASLGPSAISTIGDSFPPEKIGRATSFFVMSAYIGAGLSNILGGTAFGWLERLGAGDPAALHGFQSWQVTIMLVALPGFIIAPCFLLLKDPARRSLMGRAEKPSTSEMWREVGDRRWFLFLLIGAAALSTVVSAAEGMWAPALFKRVYHWHEEQIGQWLGTITIIAAIPGSYFAGWMTDRLIKGGSLDAPVKIAALSMIPVGILGVAMPLMPGPEWAFGLFLPILFVKAVTFACPPVAIQLAIPGHLKGQVAGLYYTCVNLLGMVLGPIIIGQLTDRVFTGQDGIRYALVTLTALLVPVIIVMFLASRRPFSELRARPRQQSNGQISTSFTPEPDASSVSTSLDDHD